MLFLDNFPFDNALVDLARKIGERPAPAIQPLPCDRYVARSCLQKAIRRAEPELAVRALANLFNYDKRATWRHLAIIALEDVGVANINVITQIVAAQRDRKSRDQMGGEWIVMAELARQMAVSEHCQASCDLFLRSLNDPNLVLAREAAVEMRMEEAAELLLDATVPLTDRALAALTMSGGLADGQPHNDPCAVFDLFADIGRSTEVVETCRTAWKISRNPMALLLPLVWDEWAQNDICSLGNDPLPPVQMIDHIPGYSLDQFTRIGNTVSRALLASDPPLRQLLTNAGIQPAAQPRCVGDLLFLYEGGLLNYRMNWATGDKLRLPYRQLPAVDRLGFYLDEALSCIGSQAPQIAQLRRQHLHPEL